MTTKQRQLVIHETHSTASICPSALHETRIQGDIGKEYQSVPARWREIVELFSHSGKSQQRVLRKAVTEKAIRHIHSFDPTFNDDKDYLFIWITFAQLCDKDEDVLSAFHFLWHNVIGVQYAELWVRWAQFTESKRKYFEAEAVIKKGANRRIIRQKHKVPIVQDLAPFPQDSRR